MKNVRLGVAERVLPQIIIFYVTYDIESYHLEIKIPSENSKIIKTRLILVATSFLAQIIIFCISCQHPQENTKRAYVAFQHTVGL